MSGIPVDYLIAESEITLLSSCTPYSCYHHTIFVVTVTGVNGAKFVGFLIGAYLAGDKSLQPIGTFSARGSTPGNHVQDRCDGANGDHVSIKPA